MQPVFNRIFVQIEKKFQDEIETESGIKFFKDTTWKLEENSTTCGTVTAIPMHVDRVHIDADFQHNVQVGDKLYFNFNVVLDPDNRIEHEGEEYWIVDYWNAIALVRNGEVLPVGSYILIDPIEEEVTSELLIIPELAQKKEKNRGVVYSSLDPNIPNGTEVEYEEVGKFWNIIEGKRLYCMYNNNILIKYNGSKNN
jgi:co-chaperonin GroES (HSP10)